MVITTSEQPNAMPLTFVDLFAGCGGLSLGLIQAGWRGVFAVEQSPFAFDTLKCNLLEGPRAGYDWPSWLAKEPLRIQDLLRKHRNDLRELRGRVTLVAGGPPCQGFSFLGRRKPGDHRNELFHQYLKVVDLIEPAVLLMENVPAIAIEFGRKDRQEKKVRGRPHKPYADKIAHQMEKRGYSVFRGTLKARDYGIPQTRERYFIVAFNRARMDRFENPFVHVASQRKAFLESLGLGVEPTTCEEALSDLLQAHGTAACPDSKRFTSGLYGPQSGPYQTLLRGDAPEGSIPDSHRFANHTPAIAMRFARILRDEPHGIRLQSRHLKKYGTKKSALAILRADQPGPTLSTLPDDVLHYCEPRIPTVREYARLMSFPDWFRIKGKYTTGGNLRVQQVPRYTQLGNAVAPLAARAWGLTLATIVRPPQARDTVQQEVRVVASKRTARQAPSVVFGRHPKS